MYVEDENTDIIISSQLLTCKGSGTAPKHKFIELWY